MSAQPDISYHCSYTFEVGVRATLNHKWVESYRHYVAFRVFRRADIAQK